MRTNIIKHEVGIYVLHHGFGGPDPDPRQCGSDPRRNSCLRADRIVSAENGLQSGCKDIGVELENEA